MKDLFICVSKEDKNISKKIVSKVESKGYSCYVLPRDASSGDYKKLIKNSKVFILILSPGAEKSTDVAEQLKIAVESNCAIIPFKTARIENNLGMQYMLQELEWVDAFGDGFDEAYEILLEIIEEFTGGEKAKPNKKQVSKSGDENFELKKSHLYGIIAVLAVGLLYFAFFNNSKTNTMQKSETDTYTKNGVIPDVAGKGLKQEEQKIVGSWKMTSYEDSRNMSAEERRITEQNIEQMKTRVLLTFKADRSFSRAGFAPQIQKGYWEYDSAKNKIYLIPENTNKKEEINIVNLTDKEMTFVVTESVNTGKDKPEIVTTKLTFQKQ